jgi:hypothetical protein
MLLIASNASLLGYWDGVYTTGFSRPTPGMDLTADTTYMNILKDRLSNN